VYFPQRQILRNPSIFVVRATTDAAALVGPVRALVASLDPQLPIYDVRLLSDYVERARATRGFTTLLAALFALVALVLSAVGVYGVVAYSVTERHHEFGVRLALGARAGQLIALVVGEGVRLAVQGLLIGVAGAALATWWLRSQLYGVSPWDLASYGIALPVLVLVAVAASAIPARRALAANPVQALRSD
jgi:putative ABC transport system permease protein